MPELPEVEILVRHLAPILKGKRIRSVKVHRAKVITPTTESELQKTLTGATFTTVLRRGKYLMFTLRKPRHDDIRLVGHLGMTGRIYLLPKKAALPKHAAVTMDLGSEQFVYEDFRYFGRFTLDPNASEKLGPEPLGEEFTVDYFSEALKSSSQAIKIKLLDQTLVAGVGNIYASEALFRAKISPRLPAKKLTREQVKRLRQGIRDALAQAITYGSTLPLAFAGDPGANMLFYYGDTKEGAKFYEDRLFVYDRAGKPCVKCKTPIKRFVQAARSTFYCPKCQPPKEAGKK